MQNEGAQLIAFRWLTSCSDSPRKTPGRNAQVISEPSSRRFAFSITTLPPFNLVRFPWRNVVFYSLASCHVGDVRIYCDKQTVRVSTCLTLLMSCPAEAVYGSQYSLHDCRSKLRDECFQNLSEILYL